MRDHGQHDFLVIGGGLAGLSLALELARAGVRVACVEAMAPGFGCSSGSLGLVYPISPLTAPMEISSLSMEAWHGFRTNVRQVEVEAGASAIIQSRNLVELKSKPETEATREAYAAIGYRPTLIGSDQVLSLIPQLHAPSNALLYDDVLHLQADHFVHLQLRAFLALGGTWLCPWAAQELCFEAGRCIGARNETGEFRAHNTVLATGAATSLFDLSFLVPVRGQSLLFRSRTPIGPFIYSQTLDIVERMDGTLHVGSTVEEGISNHCSTFEAIADLTRDLNSTLRLTIDPVPFQTLCGVRARALDSAPLVGPTSVEGLLAFTGLYRNGVVFSQLLARMFVQYALQGCLIPSWLLPQRFSHGGI